MNFDDWRGCIIPVFTSQVCDSYHQQGSWSSEKVARREIGGRNGCVQWMHHEEYNPRKMWPFSTLSATAKRSKQVLLIFCQSHSSLLGSCWMRWENREGGGGSPWIKGCVMLGNRMKPKEYECQMLCFASSMFQMQWSIIDWQIKIFSNRDVCHL